MCKAEWGQEGPGFNYEPYSGEKGTNYIRNLCIVSPRGAVGLFYLCGLGLI